MQQSRCLTVCQARRGGPPGGNRRSNAGGGGSGRRPPKQSRSGRSRDGRRNGNDNSNGGSDRRSEDRESMSELSAALDYSRQRRQRGFGSSVIDEGSGGIITITEAPSGAPVGSPAAVATSALNGISDNGSSSAAVVGLAARPQQQQQQQQAGQWAQQQQQQAVLGSRELWRDDGDDDEYLEELPETESDADWDDIAAAALSDEELAELRGENSLTLAPLAGTATAAAEAAAGLGAAGADVEAIIQPILEQFPFPLDQFQEQALRRLLAGRSVVVCAPTGAGKTAIAEAAAIHWLGQGKRVIYTTPLKALSNQKLLELRERFGRDSVGLQTGDASLNTDAQVVVMTTEILRNQLYRLGDGSRASADGGSRLADVALVVLDEVHYLGDPGRGSVWEEVVCALPAHCQLLAMSATVRNPEDLGGWITQVHGPCDTIRTTFRPVPLSWHWCQLAPPQQGTQRLRLLPLLDAKGRSINPLLLPPSKRFGGSGSSGSSEDDWGDGEGEGGQEADDGWGRWDSLGSKGGGSSAAAAAGGRAAGRGKAAAEIRGGRMRARTIDELIGSMIPDADLQEQPRWKRIPPIESVVLELKERSMLPAVWFIFSRRDCDSAAVMLAERGIVLTTPAEQEAIQAEVDALRADQPEAVKDGLLPALLAGAAAHHAGCLPAWKGVIERLFQRGLLKMVFATETLAAGINMPARTTLVGQLSRRRDGGIAMLQHNELLQMAGRAGRRGFDTQGSCVLVQGPWEDADAAWDIIRKGPEALRSQFSTGYGMVLNLLASRSMEGARAFLDRSFSRYLGSIGADRRLEEAAALEEKAQTMLADVARLSGSSGGASGGSIEELLARYEKLQGRLREEKRAAKLLRAQLVDERAAAAAALISSAGLPLPVGLDLSASNVDESSYRLPALLVAARPVAGTGRSSGSGSGGGGVSSGGGAGAKAFNDWLAELEAEGGGAEEGGGWCYLCLGADNSLYEVGARQIAAVLLPSQANSSNTSISNGSSIGSDGSSPSSSSAAQTGGVRQLKAMNEEQQRRQWLEAATAVSAHAAALPPSAWKDLTGGCRITQGSARTATAATRLPAASMLPAVPLAAAAEAGGVEALAAQRARVKEVKRQLAELKQDRRFIKASKQYARVAAKAGLLLQRAAQLREEAEQPVDASWMAFEALLGILFEIGALERSSSEQQEQRQQVASTKQEASTEGQKAQAQAQHASADGLSQHTTQLEQGSEERVRFAPLGLVARDLNGQNELWLALVLTHSSYQALTPPQLAAAVSAVVAPEAVSRPGGWVAYPPSEAVVAAVESLEDVRSQLAGLQVRAGVGAPLPIDLRLAGLVEAWAAGCDWADLMADCSLDDGDIVRLLSRTVDTLRQAAHCQHLLPPLRSAARKAVAAMNRKPISELVA